MTAFSKDSLARTAEEFNDLVASDAEWVVRSTEDLDKFRDEEGSPLAKLDDAAYREFSDSLHFHDGGIGGGTYRPLMSLPMTDIFKVYNRFGLGDELALRMHESVCQDGEWNYSFWDFCSPKCGSFATEPPIIE